MPHYALRDELIEMGQYKQSDNMDVDESSAAQKLKWQYSMELLWGL